MAGKSKGIKKGTDHIEEEEKKQTNLEGKAARKNGT